jgi:hypothetical protein
MRVLRGLIAVVATGLLLAAAAAADPGAERMPRIAAHDGVLHRGVEPWRAFGFNWGVGDRQPVLDFFDAPSRRRLGVLDSQLQTARELGANSMRIYLEVGHVMCSPTSVRATTLRALKRLLAVAEGHGIYLDITGNLVWRPARVPSWYGRLPERDRWEVQARFWRAVAGAADRSPAVLAYELTSEPIVADDPAGGYYRGEFGGFTFVQAIAFGNGRPGRAVARAWTRKLVAAVRSGDDRPVTIGLLPARRGGFAPANVADLLDVVTIHEYPRSGRAHRSVALMRHAAGFGKPVLLGETFMLYDDEATQERFLVESSDYLSAGALSFFDGRTAEAAGTGTARDSLYSTNLRHFTGLGPLLSRPRRAVGPAVPASTGQMLTVPEGADPTTETPVAAAARPNRSGCVEQ